MSDRIVIRVEVPGDEDLVRALLDAAFGRAKESKAVDQLRADNAITHAVVAEEDGELVGYCAFSPVTISDNPEGFTALALAPLAVDPGHQHQHIGETLLRAALDYCKEQETDLIFVIGAPDFYSHFGFMPAARGELYWAGAKTRYLLQVRELKAMAIQKTSGNVTFHPAFDWNAPAGAT